MNLGDAMYGPHTPAQRFRRLAAFLEDVRDAALEDAEALLAVPEAKRSVRWELDLAGYLSDAERADHRLDLMNIMTAPPVEAKGLAGRALRRLQYAPLHADQPPLSERRARRPRGAK